MSQTQGFIANPGGSQGNLCLGGAIGRYRSLLESSGLLGRIDIPVDLTLIPQPGGPAAGMPGESWNFQGWFRDVNPMQTSNFSTGLTITLK